MLPCFYRYLQKLFVLGLFISFPCWSQNEATQSSFTDESEYFAIVNETGGYLNQALHTAFWELMKSKYDEKQRQQIVKDVQTALDSLKAFQMASWLSAQNSYFAKKVVKTKEYETLRGQLEKLNGFYFSGKTIVESSEKIIQAAADRSPVDVGAGKIYITPELIEENMIGLKGSYERLKMLMTPEWKDEYKEYILPKENVSLLSLYSPDEYHEVISQDDVKIDIHIAQININKNSVYEIGAVDYQKGDKKFTDFTKEEKEIYIQEFVKEQFTGYKVNDPLMSKGDWRGHEYAKGIATVEGYNIVIMSLFLNNKALYIKYVTDSNLSLAGSDFNEFTKRLQLLEKA